MLRQLKVAIDFNGLQLNSPSQCKQVEQKWNIGLRWVNRKEQIRINAQKMMFSINDFFTKCDQIRSFLRIWSHLLKKCLMENFIFCAVN